MMRAQETETDSLRHIRRVLYAARWVVIAGILIESELQFTTARVHRAQVAISVLSVAVLTVLVGLAAARWEKLRSPALLVIADIAMVSTVVYFSDGVQSPFFALFYVTLIEAAAAFGTRGALICAGVIGVLSLAVEAADTTQPLTEPMVLERFLGTTPYLFLIAAIAGALRDRISVLADAAATLRGRQEATEREMDLARRVQMAQLPMSVPTEPGVDIEVVYEPARQVGGDLYDFHPVLPQRLGLAVADVAGKGVPAALLVSSARYALRQYYADDKAAMTQSLNDHLLSDTIEDTFVTMLHGVLDVTAGEFRYVSAGHMPPIVIDGSTGEARTHGGADLPLGVSDSATFTERRIRLSAGDTLVLYTDGVTDALDPLGDGVAAFEQLLSQLGQHGLTRLRDALQQAISAPRRVDDVTVVAVRIKPDGPAH